MIQYRDGEGSLRQIHVAVLPGVATSRCCRHLDLMHWKRKLLTNHVDFLMQLSILYLCTNNSLSTYLSLCPRTYLFVCSPLLLFFSLPKMQQFFQSEVCNLATHPTHLPFLPRQQMFQQMPGGVGTLTASLLGTIDIPKLLFMLLMIEKHLAQVHT